MFKSTICTFIWPNTIFFVTHNFCGVHHFLTFISWYGNVGIDEESDLNYVYANILNDLCLVVDTSKVAGPLINTQKIYGAPVCVYNTEL